MRSSARIFFVGVLLVSTGDLMGQGSPPNPYGVAGWGVLDDLGMPADCIHYDWNNLRPDDLVQVCRPNHYYDVVGIAWRWWGYNEVTGEINDPTQFDQWILDHLGKVWIIGNEPDLNSQDGLTKEQYAHMYNLYYDFIRQRDATAKFCIGAITGGSTTSSLNYTTGWYNDVLSIYETTYGQPMHIDIWNIHSYCGPTQIENPDQPIQDFVTPFVNWCHTVDSARYANAEVWITELPIGEWKGALSEEWIVWFTQRYLPRLEQAGIDRWFWFVSRGSGVWATVALVKSYGVSPIGQAYADLANGYPNAIPPVSPYVPDPTPAVLHEDFSSGTLADPWMIKAGEWAIENGVLRQSRVDYPWNGETCVLQHVYNDFFARVKMRVNQAADPNNWAGFLFHTAGRFHWHGNSGYLVFLRSNGAIGFYNKDDGTIQEIPNAVADASQWQDIRVKMDGWRIKIWVNESLLVDYTDTNQRFSDGYTMLVVHKTDSSFDDVSLYDLGAVSTICGDMTCDYGAGEHCPLDPDYCDPAVENDCAGVYEDPETSCDGIDNNCDGNTDEGVQSTYYADADGDTCGDPNNSIPACSPPTGYVSDNTDCDDTRDFVYPGAPELLCDGLDNDCDMQTDENCSSGTVVETFSNGTADWGVGGAGRWSSFFQTLGNNTHAEYYGSTGVIETSGDPFSSRGQPDPGSQGGGAAGTLVQQVMARWDDGSDPQLSSKQMVYITFTSELDALYSVYGWVNTVPAWKDTGPPRLWTDAYPASELFGGHPRTVSGMADFYADIAIGLKSGAPAQADLDATVSTASFKIMDPSDLKDTLTEANAWVQTPTATLVGNGGPMTLMLRVRSSDISRDARSDLDVRWDNVTLTKETCQKPVLTRAWSRKHHITGDVGGANDAGERDIEVGAGDIECRSKELATANPSTLTIIAEFDRDVLANELVTDVQADNGIVDDVEQLDSNHIKVEISGVGPNGPDTDPFNTQVNLSFPGVYCDGGDPVTHACASTLCVRIIVGDYDNLGRTNFTDFAQVRSAGYLNALVDSEAKARADFDCSGRPNFLDFAKVKNAGLLNQTAPECAAPIGP